MTDSDNQSGQFPPAGTPAFSMRTLMVVTPENALDSAFQQQPLQTSDTNQTWSQSTSLCQTCGLDGEAYRLWKQRRDVSRQLFSRLSRREQEIAGLAAAGFSSRDCADRLKISVKTVEKHRLSAYRRLEVPGLAGLIRIFIESDLPIPEGPPQSSEHSLDEA